MVFEGRRKWSENGFEAAGGYMAAKKSKLEGQFKEDQSKKAEEDGESGGERII